MTLVVLAAGLGSRYGGLKQLDPVTPNGEFIIDFSVYDAMRAGYNEVVFVIKEENHALFHETIGARISPFIKVKYAYQTGATAYPKYFSTNRSKPLGTAHALLCAKPYVSGDFAVINADDFYGADAFRLAKEYIEQHKDNNNIAHCMVSYDLGNTLTAFGTVSRGVCTVSAKNFLENITERKQIKKTNNGAAYLDNDGTTWQDISTETKVSMNFFGFNACFFEDLEKYFQEFLETIEKDDLTTECYLPSAATYSIQKDHAKFCVLNSKNKWFGATYVEDKPLVTASIMALIRDGEYPNKLWVKSKCKTQSSKSLI